MLHDVKLYALHDRSIVELFKYEYVLHIFVTQQCLGRS